MTAQDVQVVVGAFSTAALDVNVWPCVYAVKDKCSTLLYHGLLTG